MWLLKCVEACFLTHSMPCHEYMYNTLMNPKQRTWLLQSVELSVNLFFLFKLKFLLKLKFRFILNASPRMHVFFRMFLTRKDWVKKSWITINQHVKMLSEIGIKLEIIPIIGGILLPTKLWTVALNSYVLLKSLVFFNLFSI